MAVDQNALSLSEFATQSNDPDAAEAAFVFIKASSVFTDLPLITDPTMKKNGNRFIDNLAGPTWVPLNTEGTTVKSKATPFSEEIWIMRNYIDVDEILAADKNAAGNFVNQQATAYLKGTAFDLNDKFINNNHTTGDANSFVGLRARLDNPTIYGNNPACKISCGGVDLSDSGQTAATSNTMISYLQQGLDEMGESEGDGCTAYFNDDTMRRIEKGVRMLGAGGGWDMTKDAFGRQLLTYRNCKVRRIGRKAPLAGGVQTVQIISSTETAAGADGASTFTSGYIVKYGEDSLCGWQPWALKPRPKYNLDSGVIERVVFSWAFGIWQEDTRAAVRLYNIKVA